MATCKECVHVEACNGILNGFNTDIEFFGEQVSFCKNFKDRSRFVVLPCKVGDKLYTIVRGYKIRKWIVTDIFISDYSPLKETVITARDKEGSEHMRFAEHYLGNTVFLTIEEAEQALKEREENG